MKKKLVILVGGFYPYYGNPMGIVLDNLLLSLVDKFEVTILTLKRNAAQTDIKPFIYKGAAIITVTSMMHDALLRRNCFIKFWCRLSSVFRIGRFEDYWISMMKRELESFYKTSPFHAILSLGFPMQMHEAAMMFRKKHPDVKWVTYSTDSCYGNSNLVNIRNRVLKSFAVSKLVNRERRFRNNADYNFVSREIFNSTAFDLQSFKDKCEILDYTVSSKLQGASVKNDDVIRIVYAGGMPVKMRDPSYFLKVFCALPASTGVRLDVYLIGAKPKALCDAEKALPEKVSVHQSVAHNEIERIYDQNADVLLNLGNDSDAFSPSKLFDYISTGRPIIDVYYHGRIPNVAIMRYPLAFRLENYGNVCEDAKSLLGFLIKIKDRRLTQEQISQIYTDYSPKAAVEKVAMVL